LIDGRLRRKCFCDRTGRRVASTVVVGSVGLGTDVGSAFLSFCVGDININRKWIKRRPTGRRARITRDKVGHRHLIRARIITAAPEHWEVLKAIGTIVPVSSVVGRSSVVPQINPQVGVIVDLIVAHGIADRRAVPPDPDAVSSVVGDDVGGLTAPNHVAARRIARWGGDKDPSPLVWSGRPTGVPSNVVAYHLVGGSVSQQNARPAVVPYRIFVDAVAVTEDSDAIGSVADVRTGAVDAHKVPVHRVGASLNQNTRKRVGADNVFTVAPPNHIFVCLNPNAPKIIPERVAIRVHPDFVVPNYVARARSSQANAVGVVPGDHVVEDLVARPFVDSDASLGASPSIRNCTSSVGVGPDVVVANHVVVCRQVVCIVSQTDAVELIAGNGISGNDEEEKPTDGVILGGILRSASFDHNSVGIGKGRGAVGPDAIGEHVIIVAINQNASLPVCRNRVGRSDDNAEIGRRCPPDGVPGSADDTHAILGVALRGIAVVVETDDVVGDRVVGAVDVNAVPPVPGHEVVVDPRPIYPIQGNSGGVDGKRAGVLRGLKIALNRGAVHADPDKAVENRDVGHRPVSGHLDALACPVHERKSDNAASVRPQPDSENVAGKVRAVDLHDGAVGRGTRVTGCGGPVNADFRGDFERAECVIQRDRSKALSRRDILERDAAPVGVSVGLLDGCPERAFWLPVDHVARVALSIDGGIRRVDG